MTAVASGAGAAAASWAHPAVQAAGANDRLNVGILGLSRGRLLAREFKAAGARVGHVCDPDASRLAQGKKETEAEHASADLRRVLDDKSIDAVVIATPDHWHAPATILACEAGKHVYVEKPCSHNIREGRLMVEAARRSGRVMQVGSQSRSTTVLKNGIELIRNGAIGDLLIAKAWNSQRRASIGHKKPTEPPAGFDYELWVGPAPLRPFRPNCHHYTWHWWYDFGTGDAGNDGVHELDIAAWALGAETHPVRITGHGSTLFFDDDQQFPDTQYVAFEFGDPPSAGAIPAGPESTSQPGKRRRLLVYEHRLWSPYVQEGHENGNAFYGTEGYMLMSKMGGWKLFGPKNKLLKEESGWYSVPEHVEDFLDAVRSGRRPQADIEVGHRSAVLVHLANILARTGRRSLEFDPQGETFVDDEEANGLLGRTYRDKHWAVPENA